VVLEVEVILPLADDAEGVEAIEAVEVPFMLLVAVALTEDEMDTDEGVEGDMDPTSVEPFIMGAAVPETPEEIAPLALIEAV
jgi:hypothetical protein